MADQKVSELTEVVDMGGFDSFYIIAGGDSRRISKQNFADDLKAGSSVDSDKLGGFDAALYAKLAGPSFTGTLSAQTIVASGNVTAYSDRRLKEEVVNIPDALGKVSELNGVTFKRKDTGEVQTGLIAQELLAVLPEAVEENDEGYLSIAYGNVVGLLVEAIKELREEVAELKRGNV